MIIEYYANKIVVSGGTEQNPVTMNDVLENAPSEREVEKCRFFGLFVDTPMLVIGK